MNNKFLHAINEQRRRTERHTPEVYGTLGITMGGKQLVEVPDRASYAYVQVRSSSYEVIEAFNDKVSPQYGLPVVMVWQGNRYIITGRDTLRYSNWIDSSAYLPRHASTHEFEGSAGDVVFVSQEQFLPLLPMPSGSDGNQQIVIGHYNLMTLTGTFQYFASQATQNLTVWNPSSPTGALMVLVSLDGQNGNLTYNVGSGSVFGSWLTGTSDVLPFVPAVSDISRYIPLAAIRLVSSSNALTWDNIYDVRPIFGATRSVGGGGGGGGGGSSTSGLAVLNNGLLENYATQLNLLGSSFTLTHSGTEADLTIVGGSGPSGALLLDTSNGPLSGPLWIYKSSPDSLFPNVPVSDRSPFHSFASGSANTRLSAAGYFEQWSTGSLSYGVYIDDEGAAGNSLYVGQQGLRAATAFRIDSYINGGATSPVFRWFSPTVLWTRYGNNQGVYAGPFLQINQNRPNNDAQPAIELDVSAGAVTILNPAATGGFFGFPFPNPFGPAYSFDTYRTFSSGSPISYWMYQTQLYEWLTRDGLHFFEGIGLMEHTGTSTYPNGSAMGMASLNNGTVTVPTKRVTDSSRIFLTINYPGTGTVGFPYVSSRSATSGFTILSSSLSDNSRVAWVLLEPWINR